MSELLKTFTNIHNIFIVGRRWFDRKNGNTYHSAEIYVNDEFVHKIPFSYGYGEQYYWSAFVWLKENNYISIEKESPRKYCEEHNIKLVFTVADVGRKKNL